MDLGRIVQGRVAAGSLAGGVLMTIHRLSQGGADRVAMLLANGFAAAGLPCGILVFRDGGEAEAALLAMLHPDVAVVSAGPPIGSRHLELVRGLRHLERQIASLQPAVVLASSSNMGLATGVAARRSAVGGPRFAMKLTNPVIRPRDRRPVQKAYRRRLYGIIFGSFDRVMILSDAERTTLAAMFPESRARFATAINPYITPPMLAPFDRPPRTGPAQLLAVGRMMPQKRLDRLLEAFALLKDSTVRLTILGDGPGRPALERQARDLGIAARVDMPGFVDDVVPWLRRADLFVLSSDYEGLPAAVLEAFACNLPVVTTDCFDGVNALLAGAERCAVVPRDDPRALADAISESLASPEPVTGLSAIARGYGIDAAIASHIRLLEPLLTR